MTGDDRSDFTHWVALPDPPPPRSSLGGLGEELREGCRSRQFLMSEVPLYDASDAVEAPSGDTTP